AAIFHNAENTVVTQAVRIIRMTKVVHETTRLLIIYLNTIPGSHPHITVAILTKRRNIGCVYGNSGVNPEGTDFSLIEIKQINATGKRSYPHRTVRSFINFPDAVIRNALRIIRIMSQAFESFSVENIQPPKICTYPKVPVPVVAQTDNNVVTQTIRVARVVQILSECIIRPIIINETSSI